MNAANKTSAKTLSIVVPFLDEEESIPLMYKALCGVLDAMHAYRYEIIFVNDGSTDGSGEAVAAIASADSRVKYIEFSRNFGKEMATTAGIEKAEGDAVIMIDADLQHPVELIPVFIETWQSGAEIVVGVRNESKSDSMVKRMGSKLFYTLLRVIAETEIIPRATDFRLLDRAVVDEFRRFTEKERMTRGLVDWLGFRRVNVNFDALERAHGSGRYSLWKLVKLSAAGLISHSLMPLRFAGYLGLFITVGSSVLGAVMLIDHLFLERFNFSGPAILAALILFLVGVVLICLGLLAFYIGHIFRETQNRPLYVIRKKMNFKK